MISISQAYDFTGRTVVLTGGTGVLGKEISAALAACGANVALLSRNPSKSADLMKRLAGMKGKSIIIEADVMKAPDLENAAKQVVAAFGGIDCLVNGAGGNSPAATTNPNQSFFQLKEADLKNVTDLNLFGTILPSQVFGKLMADRKEGIILNITSMAGDRPLTRVGAYSAAKAAVANFTRWLAIHMAQEYSPNIRVNAVSPGFFLTEQNRFLLTDRETGKLTERGAKILGHTPMGRFGEPDDLLGAVLWLLSPASKFVTGIVLPVDGGFSAYSGV